MGYGALWWAPWYLLCPIWSHQHGGGRTFLWESCAWTPMLGSWLPQAIQDWQHLQCGCIMIVPHPVRSWLWVFLGIVKWAPPFENVIYSASSQIIPTCPCIPPLLVVGTLATIAKTLLLNSVWFLSVDWPSIFVRGRPFNDSLTSSFLPFVVCLP